MTSRTIIALAGQRLGKLAEIPTCVLLLALLWSLPTNAQEVEEAGTPLSLAYSVTISPEQQQLTVTLTIQGYDGKPIRQFESRGIREKVSIALAKTADGSIAFQYVLPIRQSTFEDTFKPVLNENFFTGFCSSILLLPRLEGKEFERVMLTIMAPEGWNVATSRGIGGTWQLDSVSDLMGTLICAGDYATYQFDLAHRECEASTRFYVAIRGQRNWNDKEFVDKFKRLARGQMDYFGGRHPAPIQFLALHLLPEGETPSIPGFNRRAPGHDTILALHTPARPAGHFEFLGMIAHEHLHNWYPNVMRSDLGPWFMEGLNDYVAYRGLLANGLHTREQFSGMLSKWHREYEWCVRTGNDRVMPYRRGMIAAWIFDIELRRATDGKHGLTDVLLDLINNKPSGGVVQRVHFQERLKKFSGADMADLYKHVVEDDGQIHLGKYLRGTGFRITEDRGIQIRTQTESEKKLFEAILSEETVLPWVEPS